jgi:hypothetical protein
MRRILLAALVAALPLTAARAGEQTARIELRGYVPVICRADFESAPFVGPDKKVQLGALHEFCNAGSGYRVVVEYQPGADPGILLVDGRPVFLGSSGSTVIQQAFGPAIKTSLLAYIPGRNPIANLHISIRAANI